MKALTICQPYADMIAKGEKVIENRTWPTSYRGPLAIHAGKSRAWLDPNDERERPGMVFGAVIATAYLIDCVHIDRLPADLLSRNDANGPWCWILDKVCPLDRPRPISGAQGLWEWQEAVGALTIPRTHAELEADFQAFHEANPHVYRLLRDFAVEAKHKGERGSIAALAEKARRWGTPGTGAYAFDNSYRAFYARLLMEREPELAGYFSVRATPHDPDYHARVRRAKRRLEAPMPAALEAGRLF